MYIICGLYIYYTKLSRAKAKRVLPRECSGIANTLFQNTREDSTHGQ